MIARARTWLAAAAVVAGACAAKKSAPSATHDAGTVAVVVVVVDAAPAGPAPQGIAPPAAGTTRLSLDRLVVDLKGRWVITRKADGGSVMVSASLEGVTEAAVLVMPSVELAGASLGDVLVRGIAASTQGHTVVKEMPVQLGASKAGVAFAGKVQVTKAPGGETLNALYYLFDVGGRGQVVALLAVTPAAFKHAAAAFGPAIHEVRVIPPAATVGAPAGAQPGTYTAMTGLGASAYVAAVGDSPTLSPVKFRLAWVQPHERASAYFSEGFHFTRDGAGNAYVYDGESYDPAQQATVFQYLANGHTAQATKIDHRTVSRLVSDVTGFRDVLPGGYDGGPPKMSFDTVVADRAGDLFVGGPAYVEANTNTHGEYFVWRPGTKAAEPVVTHPTLQKMARGAGWGTTSALHPTPDGDAWLFVITDGWPRVVYLAHGANGWSQRELDVSKFAGGGAGPTPTFTTLDAFGCPDFTGGWVFYSNGAFWRLSRDGGPIQPLLRMELPSKGVTVSGPVVLENGDLWFAANGDDSVVTYVGPDAWGHGTPAVTHQSILLGDRSRWIRARLDGKGGVALGEIAAEDILAALTAEGAPIASGVFQTPVLRLDLTTGGLFTYDTHHGVLYALEPLD